MQAQQKAVAGHNPNENREAIRKNARLFCSDCNSEVVDIIEDFASGDLVCNRCGLVLGDRIVDTRSEWRTFSGDGNDDDPSRVGGSINPLLDGPQLDTIISKFDGGSGRARELNRALMRSSKASGEKSLIEGYEEIGSLCAAGGLLRSVSDRAKILFKKVEDEKLLRGKPTASVIAACIFAACRLERSNRSYKEVAAFTKIDKNEIHQTYKLLKSKIIEDFKDISSNIASNNYMPRFCNQLNLGMDVEKAANYICEKASEHEVIAGKSPTTIVGAAIYIIGLVTKKNISLKDISEVAGVAEATIRNAYKDMYPFLESILPPELAKLESIKHDLPSP